MKKNGTILKKQLLCFFASCTGLVMAQGPYAPAAGLPGSTAIFKDSSIIKAWASGISVQRGFVQKNNTESGYNGFNTASYGQPENGLGKAEGNSLNVVSLGDGGSATLTFNKSIVNGPGPDFVVFENSISDNFLELALVQVSTNGINYVTFPAVSLTPGAPQVGGFEGIDPTMVHNLAGKYKQGFGTPFDLDDIKDNPLIDVDNINFVKIIDVTGSINQDFGTFDSKGNIINDPFPTAFHTGGFDLDGLGLINCKNKEAISDFKNLPLSPDAYWNGADGSGQFESGLAVFPNNYNTEWFSWSGYAYSNMRNDSTPGYMNQYSAITAGGYGSTNAGETNYAVAYVGWEQTPITFKYNISARVKGMYVTNTTYDYLSMKNGDAFSKKFGGVAGNDPDYFKLIIWGEKENGTLSDTVEFYLADFRYENNNNDYIVNSWKWVDLSKLGEVKNLQFAMESTDVGDWGMNTPSYFCFDNLQIVPALENKPTNTEFIMNLHAGNDSVQLVLPSFANENGSIIANYGIIEYSNHINNIKIEADTLSFSVLPNAQTGAGYIVLNSVLGTDTAHVTITLNIEESTNIATNEIAVLKVFPCPFSDYLKIETTANSQIQLFDLNGKILQSQKTEYGIANFNTSTLPAGCYFIRAGNAKTIKVIKK